MTTSSLRGLAILWFAAAVGCGGTSATGGPDTSPGAPSIAYASVAVDPGSACTYGGVRVDMGIDDNRNGMLDPAEVDATEYVCNGAPGTNALLSTSRIAPGSDCSAGGLRISMGQDADRDGVLDPTEITTSRVVCDGAPAVAPPVAESLDLAEGVVTVSGMLGAGDYLVAGGAHADFFAFATTTADTALTITAQSASASITIFTAGCLAIRDVAEWGPCYVADAPRTGPAIDGVLHLGPGDYVLMVEGPIGMPWATVPYAVRLAANQASACSAQNPPVARIPASCSAQAGAQVSVPVRVCPRCDQAAPTCVANVANAGAGQITLEPVSEVCSPNPSCPIIDVSSCQFSVLNCTFTAGAVGTYNLTVVTSVGIQSFTLTVTPASGTPSPVTCPL